MARHPIVTMRAFSAVAKAKLVEVDADQRLEFIKRSSNLIQIIGRVPNDGLFPFIKPIEDLTEHDVPHLIKSK
jgi:hypothetical protein